VCLDSFHILSRGSDPARIRDIPSDKIFFLQLADAPYMSMDVLQWSRHHRLFPGQGAWDLPAFLNHVLTAGYTGPLSLEVFNDVFRQSDPRRTAVDARRSLLALREATAPLLTGPARERCVASAPPTPQLTGYAFTELAVRDDGEVARTLTQLGLTHTGQHRSKPMQLWECGDARIIVNSADPEHSAHGPAIGALAVHTPDPAGAAARAAVLLAPTLAASHAPAEADLPAVAAPDDTEVVFCPVDDDIWRSDFEPVTAEEEPPAQTRLTHIDHVALTQPYDRFDEATLFYRSMLGLVPQHSSEIAAPFGLVRNKAVSDPDRTTRLCLSVSVLRRGADWQPQVADPQHVAFATDDLVAAARVARAAGAPLIDVPDNYYDDLDARLGLDPDFLDQIRELDILYDQDADGEFLHFYTAVLGERVFFEVVQRIGDYQGYGAVNAPIRMAAHRRHL